jgi:hypothetical protein
MVTSEKLAAVIFEVVGRCCGFFHDGFLHGFTTTEPTFLKTKPCFWYLPGARTPFLISFGTWNKIVCHIPWACSDSFKSGEFGEFGEFGSIPRKFG